MEITLTLTDVADTLLNILNISSIFTNASMAGAFKL